jgi:hypothetical protein
MGSSAGCQFPSNKHAIADRQDAAASEVASDNIKTTARKEISHMSGRIPRVLVHDITGVYLLRATNSNKMVAEEIATSTPVSEVIPSEKYSWYRGVFFNASVVGIAAFGAPGLWNAMQSVGAGGQQTPYLVM